MTVILGLCQGAEDLHKDLARTPVRNCHDFVASRIGLVILCGVSLIVTPVALVGITVTTLCHIRNPEFKKIFKINAIASAILVISAITIAVDIIALEYVYKKFQVHLWFEKMNQKINPQPALPPPLVNPPAQQNGQNGHISHASSAAPRYTIPAARNPNSAALSSTVRRPPPLLQSFDGDNDSSDSDNDEASLKYAQSLQEREWGGSASSALDSVTRSVTAAQRIARDAERKALASSASANAGRDADRKSAASIAPASLFNPVVTPINDPTFSTLMQLLQNPRNASSEYALINAVLNRLNLNQPYIPENASYEQLLTLDGDKVVPGTAADLDRVLAPYFASAIDEMILRLIDQKRVEARAKSKPMPMETELFADAKVEVTLMYVEMASMALCHFLNITTTVPEQFIKEKQSAASSAANPAKATAATRIKPPSVRVKHEILNQLETCTKELTKQKYFKQFEKQINNLIVARALKENTDKLEAELKEAFKTNFKADIERDLRAKMGEATYKEMMSNYSDELFDKMCNKYGVGYYDMYRRVIINPNTIADKLAILRGQKYFAKNSAAIMNLWQKLMQPKSNTAALEQQLKVKMTIRGVSDKEKDKDFDDMLKRVKDLAKHSAQGYQGLAIFALIGKFAEELVKQVVILPHSKQAINNKLK